MQLGIFAKTFPGSAPLEVLTSAKASGFGVVQYNMACSGLPSLPGEITAEAVSGVWEASAASGVAINAISATANLIHPDHAQRERGLLAVETIMRHAKAMGADAVTLCSGTRDANDPWRWHPDNASPHAWADLCASLERLLVVADETGVRLGIEPEHANVVADAKAANKLMRHFAHPAIRFILDPANLIEGASSGRRNAVLTESIETLSGALLMAHAKDRTEDGGVARPGKGVVDFPYFLGRLSQAGFAGPVIAHGFGADDAAGVARHLRKAADMAGVPLT